MHRTHRSSARAASTGCAIVAGLVAGTHLVGCSASKYLSVEPYESRVAVGARLTLTVYQRQGSKCLGSLGCSTPSAGRRATISSATFDPTDVFSIVALDKGKATIEIEGLRAGSAKLSISALGDEKAKTYEALVPDQVELLFRCTVPIEQDSDTAPILLPTEHEVELRLTLRAQSKELEGYGYWPVEGLALSDEKRSFCKSSNCTAEGTFRAPAAPTTLALSSPVDPAFSRQLRIVELAQVDRFEARTRDPVPVGQTVFVTFDASVAGQPLCIDQLERRYTVETPEICGLDGEDETVVRKTTAGRSLKLVGRQAGTCSVVAELVGTTLSARGNVVFAAETDGGGPAVDGGLDLGPDGGAGDLAVDVGRDLSADVAADLTSDAADDLAQ